MIQISHNIYEKYPTASFGIVVVDNFKEHAPKSLTDSKIQLTESLRLMNKDYHRQSYVKTVPTNAYVKYYKKFKKSYHVMHQLESIVLKDKEIPDTNALVQILFLTELKNMLLIACHDLSKTSGDLVMGLATGEESFINARGNDQQLKANDIYLRDEKGIIVSIIYGQDKRTRINEDTTSAIFLIEGVEGVSNQVMETGISDIINYLKISDPNAEIRYKGILSSDHMTIKKES